MEPAAAKEVAPPKEEEEREGDSGSGSDSDEPGAEGRADGDGGAASAKQVPKVDRGMLVMCSTSKEQRAASEALALFTHYADLWEEEKAGGGAGAKVQSGAPDLLDELRKEVAGLRGPKRRFEQRYTKVKGVLLYLYRGPWEKEGPDPVEFVVWMVERMRAAQEYGRFIARVVPLQVCGAAHQLIRNATPLIAAKFPKSDPSSFEIEFACRNNSAYNRRDVQIQLIALGLGYPHFVSHTMPQKTILVEITNKIAGVSVVPRYYALSRFNIQQQQSKAKVHAEASKKKEGEKAPASADALPPPPPPAAAAATAAAVALPPQAPVAAAEAASETSKATPTPEAPAPTQSST